MTPVSVKTWFLGLVGPKNFFNTCQRFTPILMALGLLLTITGAIWGLVFSPSDYLQGHSYRIIFIHVPFSAIALSLYLAMAILAIIHLVWKIKVAEWVAHSAAEVGLVMAVLSLLTGSIWGKPTWGTYWVWDARLTSMLFLAFLYIGFIAIVSTAERNRRSSKGALILAIVGTINLPIIKYSVVWWNTLHQGATFTITNAPKMDSSMYQPLLLTLLGIYALVGAYVLHRTGSKIISKNAHSTWVNQLLGATRLAP